VVVEVNPGLLAGHILYTLLNSGQQIRDLNSIKLLFNTLITNYQLLIDLNLNKEGSSDSGLLKLNQITIRLKHSVFNKERDWEFNKEKADLNEVLVNHPEGSSKHL
jgi:hypothetical protein